MRSQNLGKRKIKLWDLNTGRLLEQDFSCVSKGAVKPLNWTSP